uniref:Uncharacterized protein n=1 Tax=Magallana gigas TaxID=29159 RepID=A0A8W8JJH7_MAGGI
MEDTTANNRESKSSSEDCSPDTSSTAVPQMKRSHSDTGAASSSSSKVKKRCKQVHFAEPFESSSSQANSDSPLLLQNVPSLTSRWTEDVLSRFKIQVTQNSPDMHNVFLQDDIKEMERALADPGWIKAFTDGFQNKKICRRTLKDISRKLQQFVWQLIYMVRTHRGQEGEKVTEEMYQELFVLFAKTFGLHLLSGGNVNQYGLIAGESGRFVTIPDGVICHPMTEEDQICAVVQVTECQLNGDNSIQRSSSPVHVVGDLESKHVGQSLGVLPYSVFGERGMFGILVDGTNVTISVFKTDSSYYQKLCNGCLPKNEAAVTFSKQYNILRKDGRTECIQTFLHLKKLLEFLSNKTFP